MSGKPHGNRTPPQAAGRHDAALRSFGWPNAVTRQFDFWDARYEARRLFAETLGTFFLVLVAAGGGMVNARFGGDAVPVAARVVAPALMVMAVILFMGTVSGAHLNPAVSVAFALRGNFPWRRVPAYVAAQFAGSVLAVLLLRALIGKHGSAGLTLPGPGVSPGIALAWEVVLTAGLVSGASMNPVRSLGPALVLGDWTAWWAYLAGPLAGAVIAVGCAWVLRGPGGGAHGTEAAQGTLGITWQPGRIGEPRLAPDKPPAAGPAADPGKPGDRP
jgi:aquaporin Z